MTSPGIAFFWKYDCCLLANSINIVQKNEPQMRLHFLPPNPKSISGPLIFNRTLHTKLPAKRMPLTNFHVIH